MQLRNIVLGLLFPILSFCAAPTLVQSGNAKDGSGAGSVVVTLGNNYTTGNVLLISAAIWGPSAGEVITGIVASGVTFSFLTRANNTGSVSDSEIWCGVVNSGGANSIEVDDTTAGYATLNATVAEFSGTGGCTADAVNGNFSTSSTTITTGSVAASVANDIIFAASIGRRNITAGPINSFSAITSPNSTNAVAYEVVGSSGSYSTGWTTATTASSWAAAIVALKYAPPPLSVSPSLIPSSHAGNITLTLTGFGTAWTGLTTFTATGVTGVTKVSQNVSSTTAATLVITTGGGVGSLTISDGVNSVPITVAAPGFSITLGVPNTTTSTTVTFTGTNTIWSSETAAGLFSISGSTGASLGTPTVTTNTSATATLTIGATGGAATIADTSTTLSQPLQLNSTSGPKTEFYLESTFPAVTQSFEVTQSVDGINWSAYSQTVPTITGVRDPSVVNVGGTVAMVYNDNTTSNISTVTLYTGTSLSNLAFLAHVPVIASQPAYAPTFFWDPSAPTTLYMTVSTPVSSYGVSLLSASLSNLSSWSAATIICPYSSQCYDGMIFKVGSTYYLFYAIANTSLNYMSASAIGGPYSGATLILSGNYESPYMTYSPITGYRLYFTAAGGDNGGFYVQCGLSGGVFSALGVPTRFFLNGATQTQHGTVINYGPVVPSTQQGVQ